MLGRAYLTVAKGLKDGDSVVIGTAPTFFGLMLQSSLDWSLLFAAKLYDKTKGTITVKSLLREAKSKAGTFKNGTSAQVFRAHELGQPMFPGGCSIGKMTSPPGARFYKTRWFELLNDRGS
jgi:hypothetical protein